jgi:hypothetical protein
VNARQEPVAVLLKAMVHGFIAHAIAKSNPDQAQKLIEGAAEAIQQVPEGVQNLSGGFDYPPSLFMASLIPAAARVDAGLAAELCWRSLSLRPCTTGRDTPDAQAADIADSRLVNFMATLDGPLAMELLNRVAVRSTRRTFDGETMEAWTLFSFRVMNVDAGRLWADTLCDRGHAGAASPRARILRMSLVQHHANAWLDRKPIMEKAEVWLNSVLWTSGITEADER